jgi:hypothetical protein
MSKEQENDVFNLIWRLIQTLSSPEIAIDGRHTPSIYARFLTGLLMKHRRGGVATSRSNNQLPPPNQLPSGPDSALRLPLDQQSGSHQSTFSVSQPQSGGQQGNGGAYTQFPIYRPETSTVFGTGTIEFTNLFIDTDSLDIGMETPATMQTLKSPSFWQNMMMPG